MRVEVYLDKKAMGNSPKRIYSIRSVKTGRVLYKAQEVLLKDVELVVQPAGRLDTLKRQGKKVTKSVHAFLRGTLVLRNRSVRKLIKDNGITTDKSYTPVGYMPQLTDCWRALSSYSVVNQLNLTDCPKVSEAVSAVMHRDGILIKQI